MRKAEIIIAKTSLGYARASLYMVQVLTLAIENALLLIVIRVDCITENVLHYVNEKL